MRGWLGWLFRMRASAVRGILMLAALVWPAMLSAAEPEWRSLFDGESLEGWEQVGPGRFVVEDGMLRTEGGMGLLWFTKEKFADAEIRVEFKLGSPTANSGVFVRIPEPPESPWDAVHGGYEVQIDESGDAFHRTGVLYSLTEALAEPELGEWNELLITLDGAETRVAVNGVEVTRFREGDAVPERKEEWEPERGRRPVAGYIGLQNHGDKDAVYFRDIRFIALR